MAIQKTTLGSESLNFLSGLPAALLKEALRFSKRNSLGLAKKGKDLVHATCPRCLKAHLLKTAQQKEMDKAVVAVLVTMGEHALGHDGYYMDKEKLIKI